MRDSTTASFSVVIPTYNRCELLEKTVQSVFAQTMAPREVIVVDGGSTDGTAAYLQSLGDRIIVVRTERLPPGAARNAGAAVATTDYIAFLDSDDLWMPWTLATLTAVVERDRPVYICGSFRQFAEKPELSNESATPIQVERFENYFASWRRQFVIGAGMIAVRRDAFLGCGGFSSGAINMEDHDLSLKLGTAPGFVQIVTPLTLGWRRHPGGVTRDFARSVAGCDLLIESEQAGRYPGGDAMRAARRQIITTHARAISLECANAGRVGDAFHIYMSTFGWQLTLGRLKYLTLLPALLLLRLFRRRTA